MQLFNKKYGTEGIPVIILHGLFGMSDNWHNVARRLSDKYCVYSLDLRNHGQSPHSSAMNYNVMADDVWEFMHTERIYQAIFIGHSMGGKVAMRFCDKFPEKVIKLVVVDIAPKAYTPGHIKYFEAMKSINFSASGRKEIENQLAQRIEDLGELLFLLKNLYRKEDHSFGLKLNLDAIEKNYDEIIGGLHFRQPIQVPTCFVIGENSNYVTENDQEVISKTFSNVSFEKVPNAGHWVHAENMEGFLTVISDFLSHK